MLAGRPRGAAHAAEREEGVQVLGPQGGGGMSTVWLGHAERPHAIQPAFHRYAARSWP